MNFEEGTEKSRFDKGGNGIMNLSRGEYVF